jgi:hypothetical protein
MDFIGDWRRRLNLPRSLEPMLLPGVSAFAVVVKGLEDIDGLAGDRERRGVDAEAMFSSPVSKY